MAKQNKTTLKGYFETGDIPSQTQYADLIDSNLNLSETTEQTIAGGLNIGGNITASSNISSSGTIITKDITIIRGTGGGTIKSSIGVNNLFIDGTDGAGIFFNDAEADVDVQIRGANGNYYFKADAGAEKVGIGGDFFTTVPGEALTVHGNISSSGNLIGNNLELSGNITASGIIVGDTNLLKLGDGIGGANGTQVVVNNSIGKVELNALSGTSKEIILASKNLIIDDENSTNTQRTLIRGSVTASGNISSSATIQGLTGSFGQLDVDTNTTINGDVFVSRYIRHTGDNDTHIEFLDNKIQIHAGNIPFITFDKDAATPYPLTINNGGNRVNFRVQDKDSNLLLKTDSEAFKVNLYYAGNQKLETATGGVNITGNITASGNLKIDGSQVDFTNLPTSDPGVAGRLYNDSGIVKISL